MHEQFLNRAIQLANDSIKIGGGPFGAVIVKDGEVIAEAFNKVTMHNDPTAHAEVEAIRIAGNALGTYSMEGCTIYASCEPCPMCLGAIYWARISEVWFAADRQDARDGGFDDALIYEEIHKPVEERKIPMKKLAIDKAKDLFINWNNNPDKLRY